VQARQVLQCSHGGVAGQTGLLVQSALHRRGYGDLSLRGPALGLQQLMTTGDSKFSMADS
jgi:hypothetical protein